MSEFCHWQERIHAEYTKISMSCPKQRISACDECITELGKAMIKLYQRSVFRHTLRVPLTRSFRLTVATEAAARALLTDAPPKQYRNKTFD
jgi:hypothetical protein